LPPLIKTLRIHTSAELSVTFARKFPNVQDVQIFSLIERVSDGDYCRSDFYQSTSRAVVPFLECFPQLKSALIGGIMPAQRTQRSLLTDLLGIPQDVKPDFPKYSVEDCVTENHDEDFIAMLENLCEAFERGTLNSNTLCLRGILENEQISYTYHSRNGGRLERRIIKCFPLDVVAQATRFLGVRQQELWRYIHRRDPNCIKNSDIIYELVIGSYTQERVQVSEEQLRYLKPEALPHITCYVYGILSCRKVQKVFL
jgi:hypothetical protein